jgi:predicted enzyme related to lactoylglutathione lyase
MDLSAIRIFVRELTPARLFYERVLGLSLIHDGSQHGFCSFRSGGVDIIVEAVAADAPEDDQALVGRFTGISFAVADVHAECLRLEAQGAAFTGAPEKQFWGGWLATFEDPAGNQLQLVQLAG